MTPAASNDRQRAELVAWLESRGFTDSEIASSESPVLLPARRVLGDDGTYLSARQISERAGLGLDRLVSVQHAAGLPLVDDPDAAVFMAADGDAAVHIKRFLDLGIDPDMMLAVVRVLAQGLANATEVMNVAAMTTVLRPGLTELQIAQRAEALVSAAQPLMGPMIEDLLLLQFRRVLQTEAVNAREREAGAPLPEARPVAAAFADLVGFTALGEELPPEQLELLANRLTVLAHEITEPPVRFIKSIGDAVMVVSTDTAALLDAMLRLLEAVASDEMLPRLRIGVARGQAVSRAGDWFGSPVNLASRVTAAARPNAVLVAQTARDDVGDDARFRWSTAGSRHLKGFREPVRLFRVRRATETGPS